MYVSLLSLILSFIIGKFIIPMFIELFKNGQNLKKNFRGELIPVGMGMIFMPIILLNGVFLVIVKEDSNFISISLFIIGILGMGAAGLLDDLLGNRNVTGLKGHLHAFLKGQLTTGGFKAIFGGLLAFVISLIYSRSIIDIFINTFMIALFTNCINLLDLRPGRAIKGFILFLIPMLFISFPIEFSSSIFSLLGAALAYAPYDLKAHSMMGDVGSNILGISLGILFLSTSLTVRVILLLLLIFIHGITEKYSLTKIIENNKILHYLDQWGR